MPIALILINLTGQQYFSCYHRICNQINTTGATNGARTAYPSRAPKFIPGFQWGWCYSIFSFMCLFSRSLFVLFLLAIVLSVLRFTPLVSSNSSYKFFNTRHSLFISSVVRGNHVIPPTQLAVVPFHIDCTLKQRTQVTFLFLRF